MPPGCDRIVASRFPHDWTAPVLMRLTWRYLKTRRPELIAVILLQTTATFASLFLPDYNARIIDEGIAAGNTGLIWKLGAIMLSITLLQAAATAIAVFMGARLAMGLGAWLRTEVFAHTQSLATQDMRHFGAASLVTRSTNDVLQVQNITLMIFSFMVQAPIMGIGGVVQAVRQDAHLSVVLLVLVPTLAGVTGLIMARLVPQFRLQQDRIDVMNTVLREELTGIRVIRAFVRQPFIRSRYEDANTNLYDVAMKIGGLFSLMFPAVMIVIYLSNVGIIWFGGHLIAEGTTQVGALFAFINYVGMISMAIMTAAMMLVMIPRASVSAGRIHELLNFTPTISSPESAENAPSASSIDSAPLHFTMEDVSVRYPGAEDPVLEGITLDFQPGHTTAIIGATASGKSTLISLLPRLMDPTSGIVNASGRSLDTYPLEELRRRIAVVPQKAYLFSGTIAQTVSGVPSPSAEERERVEWALKGAQATEFVERLGEGIDAPVEPGGRNFSGGQRQRLAIARALYRRADLYVFDDSFSALDYATDARLRAGLPDYVGDAAVVIVAQRVSTIRHADHIVVLDGGGITAAGKHDDLLNTCDTYREIVASQATEDETNEEDQR